MLFGAAGLPLPAQTVVGRILNENGAPVAGAFVTLLDSAGRQRAAVLADSGGGYLVSSTVPGLHTVRAERIGMRSNVSGPLRLSAGERRLVLLTLAEEAVPLAALEVLGRSRCRLRPSSGELVARTWEEIRKALRVSSWSRSQSGLVFTSRRRQRLLAFPSGSVLRDSVTKSSGRAERGYGSRPAAELAREGYVRQQRDGSFLYYGPDEEVLASDEFLETHCLELAPRPDPRTLAIRFQPVRRSPTDIAGTASVDANSGELRVIEFRYVHLDGRLPADSAGGRVEFRRLPSGAWFVLRWRLVFPEFRLAPRTGWLLGAARVEVEALNETTGEILRVDLARGGALFVAGAPRTVAVTGVVRDGVRGLPVPNATVRLRGTGLRATSDSTGHFRIPGVQPGSYAVTLNYPGADSLPLQPAPGLIRVDSTEEAFLALSTPSPAEARAAACPGATGAVLGPDSTVLFGILRAPGSSARVTASWQAVERVGTHPVVRAHTLELTANSDGRWAFCAAPPERQIVLRLIARAGADVRRGEAVRVRAARGQVLRVDLPSPELP